MRDEKYTLLSQNEELRDVIIKSNTSGIALDQDKVDQYINVMSHTSSEKDLNNEKLAAMWMYAAQMGALQPPSVRKLTPPTRPIMLIPASAGGNSLMSSPAPPPASSVYLSPPLLPPGIPYRGIRLPYLHPAAPFAPPGSMPGTYRTHKSTKSANSQRRHRRAAQMVRAGKMEATRRQRRKSEADVVDGRAFQYTGLDRAIADSFLAQQEHSGRQSGSHVEYVSSSSSAASGNYGKAAQRSSSTTKIVCRDVVM